MKGQLTIEACLLGYQFSDAKNTTTRKNKNVNNTFIEKFSSYRQSYKLKLTLGLNHPMINVDQIETAERRIYCYSLINYILYLVFLKVIMIPQK